MKNEIQEKLDNKTKDLNKRRKEGLKKNLATAKKNKNDEFYTRYDDIVTELSFYGEKGLFKGKRIILPCDQEFVNTRPLKKQISNLKEEGQDTSELESQLSNIEKQNSKANFHKVLTTMKEEWGIESITTSYWDGTLTDEENEKLGNKKFEDVEYSDYDIVITNPPFSLFREFIALMEEVDIKYIIIGSNNAISYKEVFTLIKNNKLWVGMSGQIINFNVVCKTGTQHNHKQAKIINSMYGQDIVQIPFGGGCWFTNLGTPADRPFFEMTDIYEGNEHKYPKYDNYDAINVNWAKEIPMDYMGAMGVPITFLHKLNTDQFEILDGIGRYSMLTGPTEETRGKYLTKINGKPIYARVIIKRVK